jgi:ABC-type dipeptide/oligopeptide/nickel transport system permease component
MEAQAALDSDPDVAAAEADWSACMDDQGYEGYENPVSLTQYFYGQFYFEAGPEDDPEELLRTEIAAAQADYGCNERVGLDEVRVEVFWSAVHHIILPACILAYSAMAYITRMTRSFTLEQLNQDYVIAARAKGASSARIVAGHLLPNIAVQLVTVLAISYGGLLEGAVVTEIVFSWPGIGQYMTNALLIGDMNAVLATTLVIGLIFMLLNFLSDMAYLLLDPRTREVAR